VTSSVSIQGRVLKGCFVKEVHFEGPNRVLKGCFVREVHFEGPNGVFEGLFRERGTF
jgi:hypothetical protein